ncbi:MAG: NAD+ synthase [Chloroflexi bacterium]|nr:NAD+ synthase [Chloroflexota bacterium]
MRTLRVALAQINTTVGDLAGNAAKVLEYLERARSHGADLVCFPEMTIPGYPPEDLLLKPSFIAENQERLREVAQQVKGVTAVVGFVDAGEDLYNAAAVLHQGEVVGVYHKIYLPNYGVFDEDRYFKAGTTCPVFTIAGVGVGVNICEDIWFPTGPVALQARANAEVIVNISASPYYHSKGELRRSMLATRAEDHGVALAYVNLVGGQDELVFDGASLIFDPEGTLVARGLAFQEDLVMADLNIGDVFRHRLHDPRRRKERQAAIAQGPAVSRILVSEAPPDGPKPPLPSRAEKELEPVAEVYAALVLGTRDYVTKNGFKKVAIGLSGGIDSSLVAVIAVDALGPENVTGVAMPSRYSAEASLRDARALAQSLGMGFMVIPIEEPFKAYINTLAEPFRDTATGVAEENLQARIRGNLLMALSNKFGWLVLTTGNKSEMACGYATLYGDMAGGFAVIKDVLKTLVYKLAHYRNSLGEVIPHNVLVRAPTAELRPNQLDTDSLPPYDILDPILKAYVEEDKSLQEIVALGFDSEMVQRVIQMVDRNEYKRRQSPPGIKITPRAFGKDRRLPITSGYRNR